jgi:hypothetical protein
MKKIPTIFKRDDKNAGLVTTEINPLADWVFKGEGIATRKYDGTCCAIINGLFYARREYKPGTIVFDNTFIETDRDLITGKVFGWVLVTDEPQFKYHKLGLENTYSSDILLDGTYELVGPKVQGNAENKKEHILINHSLADVFENCPRTFDGLKLFLEPLDIEGIVFHHPDGRMAKIKKRDFGLRRK